MIGEEIHSHTDSKVILQASLFFVSKIKLKSFNASINLLLELHRPNSTDKSIIRS
jgi:hypothetical protein